MVAPSLDCFASLAKTGWGRPVPRPEPGTDVPPFPFSAIVGQDEMRQALLIAAVDPAVGGVLVFGDRGTGKSTAIRALAALLPPMNAVAGCPYNCDPASPADLCPHCAAGGPRKAQKKPCRWWTCRSAPPRTGWSAPSTSNGRSAPG